MAKFSNLKSKWPGILQETAAGILFFLNTELKISQIPQETAEGTLLFLDTKPQRN